MSFRGSFARRRCRRAEPPLRASGTHFSVVPCQEPLLAAPGVLTTFHPKADSEIFDTTLGLGLFAKPVTLAYRVVSTHHQLSSQAG